MENETNGKTAITGFTFKRKAELSSFRLFAANGNGKLISLVDDKHWSTTTVSANVPNYGDVRQEMLGTTSVVL
jgi:hypothetical protein